MSRATNQSYYVPKGARPKSALQLFIEKHNLPPFCDMLSRISLAFAVAFGLLILLIICGFRMVKFENGDVECRFTGFIYGSEATLGKLNSSDGQSANVIFGKFYYSDGSVYSGDSKNLLKDGQGTLTFEDGSVYVGTFSEGKYHGGGTYTGSDGSSYVGEYKNGLFDGYGTLKAADGSVYTGEFSQGEKSGKGEIKYSNGDLFYGDFENDMRSYGVYRWVNGESIEGKFENNLPVSDEKIIYTDSTGDTYKAFYVDGSLTQKYAYTPPANNEENTENTPGTDSDQLTPAG